MNTKRILSVIAVALITFTAAIAQRNSVVTEDGSTSVYRTLQQAIEGAAPSSTIYLPGGGFTIADSIMITKKLIGQLISRQELLEEKLMKMLYCQGKAIKRL